MTTSAIRGRTTRSVTRPSGDDAFFVLNYGREGENHRNSFFLFLDFFSFLVFFFFIFRRPGEERDTERSLFFFSSCSFPPREEGLSKAREERLFLYFSSKFSKNKTKKTLSFLSRFSLCVSLLPSLYSLLSSQNANSKQREVVGKRGPRAPAGRLGGVRPPELVEEARPRCSVGSRRRRRGRGRCLCNRRGERLVKQLQS